MLLYSKVMKCEPGQSISYKIACAASWADQLTQEDQSLRYPPENILDP